MYGLGRVLCALKAFWVLMRVRVNLEKCLLLHNIVTDTILLYFRKDLCPNDLLVLHVEFDREVEHESRTLDPNLFPLKT